MTDDEPAPQAVRLARYMDELHNHTAHDPEYREIIASRVADLCAEVCANDNEPWPRGKE